MPILSNFSVDDSARKVQAHNEDENAHSGIRQAVEAKQDKITGAASTVVTDNLAKDAIVVTDSDGKIAADANISSQAIVSCIPFQNITIDQSVYTDITPTGAEGIYFQGKYYIPAESATAKSSASMKGLLLVSDDGVNFKCDDYCRYTGGYFNKMAASSKAFVTITNGSGIDNQTKYGTLLLHDDSIANSFYYAEGVPNDSLYLTDVYWNNVVSEFALVGWSDGVAVSSSSGIDDGSFLYTSPDGKDWTLRINGASGTFDKVVYVDGHYVISDKTLSKVYVIGDDYSVTSVDISAPIFDMIQRGNQIVAIGKDATSSNVIPSTSTNGSTWTYGNFVDMEAGSGSETITVSGASLALPYNKLYYKEALSKPASMHSEDISSYVVKIGSKIYYSYDGITWLYNGGQIPGSPLLSARDAIWFWNNVDERITMTQNLLDGLGFVPTLKATNSYVGILNNKMAGIINAVSADNVTHELGDSPSKIPSERAVRSAVDTLKRSITKITYGTDDLTAGTSELETGAIYLVYEV